MMQYESGIVGKWPAMLKKIAPRLSRVAFVANPKFRGYDYFGRFSEAAAPALAIELVPTPISNEAADIERSIEAFARVPGGGPLMVPDASTITHRASVSSISVTAPVPSTARGTLASHAHRRCWSIDR